MSRSTSSPAAEDETATVKVDRDVVDKYIRAKYGEAMGLARKNQYARAFEMARGLLALEPRCAIADRININPDFSRATEAAFRD